jgi:hypothetical protein
MHKKKKSHTISLNLTGIAFSLQSRAGIFPGSKDYMLGTTDNCCYS